MKYNFGPKKNPGPYPTEKRMQYNIYYTKGGRMNTHICLLCDVGLDNPIHLELHRRNLEVAELPAKPKEEHHEAA